MGYNGMTFDDALPDVRRALQGLRFGSVELVIHEGQLVQIERREKIRPDTPPPRGGASGRPPQG
jgi:hypothetical protein